MHNQPSNWSTTTIEEVVDPQRRVTYGIVQPGPRQREAEGVPLIRGQNYSSGIVSTDDLYYVLPRIANSYRRSSLEGGDLLLSIVGYVGAVAEVPETMAGANITQTTARLAIAKPNVGRYFLYYFQSEQFHEEVKKYTKGSAQPGLNLADVVRMKAVAPPVPEQRLIAEILDTVDLAIRKAEAMIAKLGQVKQGLLHDLLTRGIDDNGQLRDPDRHPEQFKDSPLGRIPKEWEITKLYDGVEFITDYRGSTPPYAGDGIPVISAENVGNGRVRSTTKFVTFDVYLRTSTRGFPEPGDVIFTTEAPVGEVAQVPSDRPYRLTRRVIAIRPKKSWWRKNFLFWFVYYRARTGAWGAYMHGSTVPRILKPDILARNTVKPGLAEQDQIAKVVDEHERRASDEVESLAKLRLLKQGLMDDLLTGRVRVTSLLQEAAT